MRRRPAWLNSTISSGTFDVGANGGAALEVITALPAAQSAGLAMLLGDVAAQDATLGVGERRELASGDVTIAVERFSAASMGGVTQRALGGVASLQMPLGFVATSLGQGVDEASVVGVAATVFGPSSIGAFFMTAPATGSTVASFGLSASGVGSLVVDHLSEPIAINLVLGSTSGAAVCKYWDVGLGAWSTAGVTTQRNTSTGSVVCLTTHLTTFGVFDGAEGGGESLNTGAIVGGVVGGAVVLVAAVIWMVKKIRATSKVNPEGEAYNKATASVDVPSGDE